MSEFIGRQIDAGIAVEAVRGTAETTATKFLRKVSANIIPNTNRVIDDSAFGKLEDADRIRSVQKWNEGDLEGVLHADPIGFLFYQLYGEVESTLVGSGVYDHVFTLEQTILHPTLTLFIKDSDVRSVKMANTVIQSMEITIATDNYVRFTASMVAKAESSATITPSIDDEIDFVSRDAVVKIADTEGGLAGATALKIKNLSITWDAGAIIDYVFGNYSPDNIYNGRFSIEGSFTKNYVDQTFEDLYKNDTFKYMSITITGETGIGGGNFPTLTILLNKVQIQDWSRGGGNDELITEEVAFKAFFNADDDQQSEITLRNNTASYAVGS